MTDQLKNNLSALHLKAMAQHLDAVLLQSEEKNLSFSATLLHLTELEMERRWQTAIKLRWDQSRLPEKLSIDQFDFNHHKSRKEQKNRIVNLLNLVFIKERMDVIFIAIREPEKPFWPNASALPHATPISRFCLPAPWT